MSNYGKCVHQLFQRASETWVLYKSRKLPTLEPMIAMSNRMKHPQNEYKCIHIGGTNGKGSTSTKIAAALTACGYRVGLFTSPHLSTVRERICVNGKIISKQDFVADFNKIIHYEADIKELRLTYFEILQCMAFYHFRRISVDFAVIEVGVGGTWDASNIIESPLMSIIVSIALDHQKTLGSTIQKIATDKCGIIKKRRPIVIGQSVPYSIAKAKANEMQSELYQIKKQKFENFDDHNSKLAHFVLQVLNSKYFILPKDVNNDTNIKQILQIRPMCRLQMIEIDLHKLFKTLLHSNKDLLTLSNRKWLKKFINSDIEYSKYKDRSVPIQCVLDVAHNPEAFRQLFLSLTKKFDPLQYKYRVLLTINPHKELEDCGRVIAEYADFIHCVSSEHEGFSLDVGRLSKLLVEDCEFDQDRVSVKGNGQIFVELMYALNECYLHNNFMPKLSESEVSTDSASISKQSSSEQKTTKELDRYKTEILIVCGSFHIMDEVRKGLGMNYDDDAKDLAEYENSQKEF